MTQDRPLGAIQRQVLETLAAWGPRSAVDAVAWYPLNSGQVRTALDGLLWRGLVEPVGFDGRGRTFDLTAEGRSVVEAGIPAF